jgi:hypothetical protein
MQRGGALRPIGQAAGAAATLAALAALALAPATPLAAQRPPTEDAVKAAFLPKFPRYVAWPAAARPAPGQPYTLCLLGEDRMRRLIEQAAAGEIIDGQPVAVRRLESAQAAFGCHMVFVDGGGAAQTAALLAQLQRLPVLTVTHDPGGAARGIIHFAVQSGRVRFHIDNGEAQARGLAISSRLLSLAASVRQRRS